MKKLILLLLCIPMLSFAQTEPETNLFLVVHLTVKKGMDNEFEASVKAHNEAYHGEGLYFASVYNNINGPFGGTYAWVMGPTNYSALDTRPQDEAHDADWEKVLEYVDDVSTPMYMSLDRGLSNIPEAIPGDKSLLWIYDVAKGKYPRFAELVSKVNEVYKASRPDEYMAIVWNEFANNDGHDVAIVWSFDKWAFLDDNRKFSIEYEAVHGSGSWMNFLNEFEECIDGRQDFIRQRLD